MLIAVPRYVSWILADCQWCHHRALSLDEKCFSSAAWVCIRCEHFVAWVSP